MIIGHLARFWPINGDGMRNSINEVVCHVLTVVVVVTDRQWLLIRRDGDSATGSDEKLVHQPCAIFASFFVQFYLNNVQHIAHKSCIRFAIVFKNAEPIINTCITTPWHTLLRIPLTNFFYFVSFEEQHWCLLSSIINLKKILINYYY